jgi:hypothetical protein
VGCREVMLIRTIVGRAALLVPRFVGGTVVVLCAQELSGWFAAAIKRERVPSVLMHAGSA